MNPNSPKSFPSGAVKIRLLQDAVYVEDGDLWTLLLRYRPHLEGHFQEIGLELVVHETDGFGYLQQAQMDEGTGIPRLFRREKLSKGVAIIGVVLRELLLQFDEKVHDESRLLIKKETLLQLAAPFFPETNDEIRTDRRIETALNKAEEMGLVRKLSGADDEDRYEVRRIIKARFPAETLKILREKLQSHVNARES